MKRLGIPVFAILIGMQVIVMGCSTPFSRVNTYNEEKTTISVRVNQEFIIILKHPSPRVGNHWEEKYDDKMLALVETKYTPDDKEHPDFGGKQNFRFKALAIGSTEATFTYKTVTDRVIEEKKFTIYVR